MAIRLFIVKKLKICQSKIIWFLHFKQNKNIESMAQKRIMWVQIMLPINIFGV